MLSYSTPPEVILECIQEVLEDKEYKIRTVRLRKLARELNGPYAVRKILEKEIKEKGN